MTQVSEAKPTVANWSQIVSKSDQLAAEHKVVAAWRSRFALITLAASIVAASSSYLLATSHARWGFRGLALSGLLVAVGAVPLRWTESHRNSLSKQLRKDFKKEADKDVTTGMRETVDHLVDHHLLYCPWVLKRHPYRVKCDGWNTCHELRDKKHAARFARKVTVVGALGGLAFFAVSLALQKKVTKPAAIALGGGVFGLILTAQLQVRYESRREQIHQMETLVTKAARKDPALVHRFGHLVRKLDGKSDAISHCPRLRTLVTDGDLLLEQREQLTHLRKLTARSKLTTLAKFSPKLKELKVNTLEIAATEVVYLPNLEQVECGVTDAPSLRYLQRFPLKKIRLGTLPTYDVSWNGLAKLTTTFLPPLDHPPKFAVKKVTLAAPTVNCPEYLSHIPRAKRLSFKQDPGFTTEHLKPLFHLFKAKRVKIRNYLGGIDAQFARWLWDHDYELFIDEEDDPLKPDELTRYQQSAKKILIRR